MPEVPAYIHSTATFDENNLFSDALEVFGDADWVSFNLDAGETVRIYASMFGTPPPNTNVIGGHIQLDVFDRFGVHQNGGWDIYAETYGVVQFTSQRDDKYFVQIRNDFAVGDYTLSLLETVTPEMSPDRILHTIDHGSRVEDREISVYFAPEGESSLGYTSVGFNAYQISRFQAAFDIIESLIDVEFSIVDNRIDADFDLYLDQEILGGSNTLGRFGLPDSILGAGQGYFNATFLDDVEGGNLEAGAEGFFVILHELLHGLGLVHPHETMGAAITLYDVGALRYHQLVELDQAVYTIQSYDRGWGTGPANQATQGSNDFGHAMTPMALDVAALQFKYGANTTTAAGNTVYSLSGAEGPGEGWQIIWDTGGWDEIRAETDAGASIDLRAANLEIGNGSGGYPTFQFDVRGGYTIAHDVMIEVARGGAGNDRLIGNIGDNRLIGGAGADRMSGGLGNDFYSVDDARDIVQGERAFAEGGGIDTVRSFVDFTMPENIEILRLGILNGTNDLNGTGNDAPGTIVGNAGRNEMIGRGGNDQLNGNGGDDLITGNTGRDTLVGGAGNDTFVYTSISESRVGIAERDVINGFDRGGDKIDLSAMDANLGRAGEGAFTFVGTSGFSGAAGELRLQGLGGANAVLVEGDLRGDGVADFQIFVNLTTVLGAGDFIL